MFHRPMLVVSLALVLCAACSKEPEVHPDMARANALLQAGKATQAAELYKRRYDETGDDSALLGLGLSLRAAGGHVGAVAALSEVREARPKDPLIAPALAFSLAMLGRFDEAFAVAADMREAQGDRAAGALLMAALARTTDQRAQAFEAVRSWRQSTGKTVAEVELSLADLAALAGDGALSTRVRDGVDGARFLNPGGAVELARLYLRQGRFEPALALLEALRASENPPGTLWTPLLTAHVELGEHGKAAELLPLVPEELRQGVRFQELSAHVALAEGRPADALRAVTAGLAGLGDGSDQRRLALRILLVQALVDLKRSDEAAQELKAVGDAPSAPPASRLQVADLWAAVGDTDHARKLWETLRSAQRVGEGARLRLLSMWLEGGELEAARREAEAWVKQEPGSSEGRVGLARVAVAEGLPGPAMDSLDAALQRDPAHLPALRMRFELTQKAEGDGAALTWLKQALKDAEPAESPAVHAFGYAVLSTQPDEGMAANAQARLWMEADPADPQPVVELARSLQKQRLGSRAVPLFREALSRAPDLPSLWAEAAQAEAQHGDVDRAIELLERLREQRPEEPALLNNLAYLYGARLVAKRAEGARSQQEGKEQVADDPDLARALGLAREAAALGGSSAAMQDTLGWLLLLKGEAREALPLLQAAAKADPDSAAAAAHLGLAWLESGQPDKASRELKRARRLDHHHDAVKTLQKRLAAASGS